MSWSTSKAERELLRFVDWGAGTPRRTVRGVVYVTHKDARIARKAYQLPRNKSRFGMTYRRRAKAIRGRDYHEEDEAM